MSFDLVQSPANVNAKHANVKTANTNATHAANVNANNANVNKVNANDANVTNDLWVARWPGQCCLHNRVLAFHVVFLSPRHPADGGELQSAAEETRASTH